MNKKEHKTIFKHSYYKKYILLIEQKTKLKTNLIFRSLSVSSMSAPLMSKSIFSSVPKLGDLLICKMTSQF